MLCRWSRTLGDDGSWHGRYLSHRTHHHRRGSESFARCRSSTSSAGMCVTACPRLATLAACPLPLPSAPCCCASFTPPRAPTPAGPPDGGGAGGPAGLADQALGERLRRQRLRGRRRGRAAARRGADDRPAAGRDQGRDRCARGPNPAAPPPPPGRYRSRWLCVQLTRCISRAERLASINDEMQHASDGSGKTTNLLHRHREMHAHTQLPPRLDTRGYF